jgi:hypothetical protein
MRLPERPIQTTCKLGRITHECTFIPQTGVNQFPLNRLDTAVHHVARRNTVSASECIAEGDFGYAFYGGFCVDCAVGVEEAAMAV